MVIYALKQVWHLDPYLVFYYTVITQATLHSGKNGFWSENNFLKRYFSFHQ